MYSREKGVGERNMKRGKQRIHYAFLTVCLIVYSHPVEKAVSLARGNALRKSRSFGFDLHTLILAMILAGSKGLNTHLSVNVTYKTSDYLLLIVLLRTPLFRGRGSWF